MSILRMPTLRNPYLPILSAIFFVWRLAQMGNCWLQGRTLARFGCGKLLMAYHCLLGRDTRIGSGPSPSVPMQARLLVVVMTGLCDYGRSALDTVSTHCKDIRN